jgi:hypothetical protein
MSTAVGRGVRHEEPDDGGQREDRGQQQCGPCAADRGEQPVHDEVDATGAFQR